MVVSNTQASKLDDMATRHGAVAPRLSADEALNRLVEGNRRFSSGMPEHNHVTQERLASLASGQAPFAAILGCADSRVPPELVFDQSFGDLFVLRLAGNVLVPSVAGSIQYAHLHLGVSVLVVLGHEGCGAVAAAVASKLSQVEHPQHIQGLVELIEPGLLEVDFSSPQQMLLQAAVEANVRSTVARILATPEVRLAMSEQRDIRIVGAVYELTSGRVRWLN